MKEFIEKLIEKLEGKKTEAENEMHRLCNENYTLLCRFDRADIEENTSESFKEAIEIVNQLAEEMNLSENLTSSDGWIPCSERLPNCEKNFLVTLRDGDVKVARYEKEENIWVDIIEGYFEYPVVAWCELPEPYKKGSETDE